MARATAARVLVRLGGTYPVPWTEALVTSLCTQIDYIIDGEYPALSTTSNPAIELAVDVVMHEMLRADMHQSAGGAVTTMGRSYAIMPALTDEMRRRIEAMLNVTYPYVTTVDMVED